jgi:hypothetical protein
MTERTEHALREPAVESVAAYVPTRGHQPTAVGLGSIWDMEATATHTVLCVQCLKTYLFSSGSETVRAAMKNEAQLRNEPDKPLCFQWAACF